MTTPTQPAEDLARILDAARRLGVELDEGEALRWLASMAADLGGEIVLDAETGVFGHRVSMLDFSPSHLLASGPSVGSLDSRMVTASRPRWLSRAPRRSPRSRPTPAIATTSSGSTSTLRPARTPAASWGR